MSWQYFDNRGLPLKYIARVLDNETYLLCHSQYNLMETLTSPIQEISAAN